MGKPTWFVLVLLAIIMTLMIAQLAELHLLQNECGRWGKIVIDHAERQSKLTGKPPVIAKESDIEECRTLEEEHRTLADQYLEIVLALLGGGAIAAGVTSRSGPRE